MKICMPIISSGFSGAENVVYFLAQQYSFLGHDVLIILNEDIRKYYIPLNRSNRICIHTIGPVFDLKELSRNVLKITIPNFSCSNRIANSIYHRLRTQLYLKYFNSLSHYIVDVIQNFKSEILHVNMHMSLLFYAFIYPYLRNILKIYTFHSTIGKLQFPFPWNLRLTQKKLLSSFDLFTAVSNYTREYWQKCLPNREIVTIYNGVDLPLINKIRPISLHENFNIFFPGGFKHFKGVEVLLKAFIILANEFPDVNLVIAGEYSPHDRLFQWIQRQAVKNRVKVLGPLEHRSYLQYLASANVMVLPTQSEGFGLSILEAMSLGVPVLCTKVGGIPEIFSDGENGWYIENEVNDLVQKLKYVYNHRKTPEMDLIREYSKNKALKFSWENIARNYAILMESEYARFIKH